MPQTITEPVVEVLVPDVKLEKGEREYQAFLRLLPQLLVSYGGQYVAVHEGEVIDADADDIVLVQRVHARVGYVPVYVGLVADRLPLLHIPHYREYRPANRS
jgi:hypothetical protein